MEKHDLIIIGSGAAGLTAGIYASRYEIDHLVIGQMVGGQALEAHWVRNFPTEDNISGHDLMVKIHQNALSLGVKILADEVVDLQKAGAAGEADKGFILKTRSGKEFQAKTLILAWGMERRRLAIKGEKEFSGKGVSYCATCDGPLFKNKIVAVIGGGNSALTAALYLADLATEVYLVYRGGDDYLRAMPFWATKVKENKKIKKICQTNVIEFAGDKKLEKMILDEPCQGENELKVDGVFIEIGLVPKQNLIEKLALKIDARGAVAVGGDQGASLSGVWAAGDISSGSNHFHQVITACSEGAVAAESVFRYLKSSGASGKAADPLAPAADKK